MPRGKKTCPKCQASVGPRLAICECGHEFTFKQGKAPGQKRKRIAQLALLTEKPFEALTENPDTAIGVNDREAFDSFMDQMRACKENSNHTGGCYSAFLHHRHGVLQVEVWFPMRLK